VSAVQPYQPALGDWVFVDDRACRVVVKVDAGGVGVGVEGGHDTPGPWERPGSSWLPGWSGFYGWVPASHLRPATPAEIQAAQLELMATQGL
jgi:hypothetical protein